MRGESILQLADGAVGVPDLAVVGIQVPGVGRAHPFQVRFARAVPVLHELPQVGAFVVVRRAHAELGQRVGAGFVGEVRVDQVHVQEEAFVLVLVHPLQNVADHVGRCGPAVVGEVLEALIEVARARD